MISKKIKNPPVVVEVVILNVGGFVLFFFNFQIMRYGCLNKMEILTPRVSAASFALVKSLQRAE